MILHKIFHLHMSVDQARHRLANVQAYRHRLTDIEQVDFSGEGTSHWRVRLPFGFKAEFMLTDVCSDHGAPGWLFKSVEGNVETLGTVSFHAVRPDLAEVELLMNYEICSPLWRAVDAVFHLGERFVVKQLRGLRRHFESQATTVRGPARVLAHRMTAVTT